MSASYEVYLLAPDSDYVLDYFDSGMSADAAGTGRIRKAFGTLEYTNVVNGIGNFSISLPCPQFDVTKARLDSRLMVWRKLPNGARTLDFAGLVRSSPRPEIYQRGSEMYYMLRGWSYNHVLARRVIAYKVSVAGYQHSGAADDVMKDFVYENLGAGAGAGRDISAVGFTIQADATAGTPISKQASFDGLIETLQAIANDSHSIEATCAYFGVVPLNNGWQMEFRTRIGQWGNDHRHPSGPSGVTGAQGPVVLSLDRQNLDNVTLIHDAMDEFDVVYGLGQGEGVARVLQTASDTVRIGDSPLNRIEETINASNCSLVADVLAAAQAKLREGRPRRAFSATVVDVPGTIYGLHYGFGDYVTAAFAGYVFDCRMYAVTVRVADGGETISAQIRSET